MRESPDQTAAAAGSDSLRAEAVSVLCVDPISH